jgi:hypothetical protein
MNSFAEALARNPAMVTRLMETHVSDEKGRCRGCPKAGTGLPGERWPCALRFHAAAAEQMLNGGLPPVGPPTATET